VTDLNTERNADIVIASALSGLIRPVWHTRPPDGLAATQNC